MKKNITVLVVDDETEIRTSLEEILTEEGYGTRSASTAHEALEKLERGAQLVMLDIRLGSENGMDLLQKIREKRPEVPVIMITGHGSVALAAEAFRLGASDFLEKPLRLVQVRAAVRNAVEKINLRKNLAAEAAGGKQSVVLWSPAMKELYGKAERLASLRAPVMVLGPSGSGKELLARALHFGGSRAQGPFIATNAASMPVTLAEDELFGHEKGAFTGAESPRAGKFEDADGGTLFLDEVADMDPAVQAKLLRVIENGQVQRLGSNRPLSVDVRVLCATHKDLPALVKQGRFREDLYFRLSGFVLAVPPLCSRKEDIPELARLFLNQICEELGSHREFGEDAMAFLLAQPFPGNVRELRHLVSRAAVYASGEVLSAADLRGVADTSRPTGNHPAVAPEPGSPEEWEFRNARINFEKSFLVRALEKFGGNITLTAQKLGMAQSNLSRKLKDLGLR
ncbi:MAG: sigma-54 dependent transcriptional regulator [Fibrobacterota bacterium]